MPRPAVGRAAAAEAQSVRQQRLEHRLNRALSDCYSTLLPFLGANPEPFEVLARADEHRAYWRPNRVRLLLLAESHVYTQTKELDHYLRPNPLLPPGLPAGYVRLVYSLGYGEDVLLDRPIEGSRNSGTPQFWKLFLSCLTPITQNLDFAPILVSRTPTPERLANKVSVLQRLQDQGIWLLDASIAALYSPTNPKPNPESIAAVVARSWDGYIGPLIEGARPEGVLCIGRGVARILGSRLDGLAVPWKAIDQPNARVTAQVHMAGFALCHRASRDPRALAGPHIASAAV